MVTQPRQFVFVVWMSAVCVIGAGGAGLSPQSGPLPPSHYGLSSAPKPGQAVGSGVSPHNALPTANVNVNIQPVQPISLENPAAQGPQPNLTQYRPPVSVGGETIRGQNPDSSWNG